MVFAINYALKSINRRKQKNLITAVAIALGVALFISTQVGSNGIIDSVAKINLDENAKNDITIIDPTSPNGLFNASVIEAIEAERSDPSLTAVQTISGRVTYYTSVYSSETGQLETGVAVRGINPEDEDFGDFVDEKGDKIDISTILTGYDVIVSSTLDDDMNLPVDSTIQISVPNGLGNSTTIELTVKSIYNDLKDRGKDGAGPTGTFRISQLYINIQTLQNLFATDPIDLRNYVTEVQIVLSGIDRSIENFDVRSKTFPGKETIENAIDKINEILEDENPNLLVYSPIVIDVDTLYDDLAGLVSVLNLFAIMLNGVALLLIINVQSMAVDDRKNQTAILRALGSSTRTIFTVFLIEALLIGIVGALLGLILGFFVGLWIMDFVSNVFEVQVTGSGLAPSLVIIAVIAGVVLSIVTAVAPSLNAARLNIANALRGIGETKKPRKGYWTLIFGILLLPVGLMFATQVGDLTDDRTWEVIDDQITIILGFGLTLAGIGLLLTLVLPRRIALSISGISLFGLGTFWFVWAIGKAKSGEGGNLFSIILLYMVIGSTMLVSVNYDSILKGVDRLLFVLVGFRAISQVTTRQMIGKKNRGVLVYTILTVILVLTIFIASAAETQRVSVVNAYADVSDGVDIVVETDNAFDGTRERIANITNRAVDLGYENIAQVTNVFEFRRSGMAIYTKSPLDETFDISTDVVGMPVVEVPKESINPDGDWGPNSFNIQFYDLSDEVGDVTGKQINIKTSKSEHLEIRDDVFNLFWNGYTRKHVVTYNAGTDNERKITETQQMLIGGFSTDWVSLDLEPGATVYLQAANGSILPFFFGARTFFDMLGNDQFPLYGNAFLVPPTAQLPAALPFESEHSNVFLVRSDNEYGDQEENELLAMAIEEDLNNLNNPSSFSSRQDPPNLIGAHTSIVKDNVEGFFFQNAGFWDFLGAFSTLGLVIGALGMMIIAVRSVSERRREIGMMRSIGFSKQSVVYGVLIEMVVLSLLSLIVGVTMAIIFSESFADSIFGVEALYPMGQILSYVFGLLGLAILSGVIPGYNASKVAPSQALRYTG